MPLRASSAPSAEKLRLYRRLRFGDLAELNSSTPASTAATGPAGPTNPVIISGDIRSSWVNDVKGDYGVPSSPVVATEFVGTSITSDFPATFLAPVNAALVDNPHVKDFDGVFRGSVACRLDRQQRLSEYRVWSTPWTCPPRRPGCAGAGWSTTAVPAPSRRSPAAVPRLALAFRSSRSSAARDWSCPGRRSTR